MIKGHSVVAAVVLITLAGCSSPSLAKKQRIAEEPRVWLAVAQHVAAEQAASAGGPQDLLVYSRTTFPDTRAVNGQLNRQAVMGFCKLSGDEQSMLSALDANNHRVRSVRDALADQPGFVFTDIRPENGGYLGMSIATFDYNSKKAYLNVERSAHSGSIVKMELKDGEWKWIAECATWTSD